jgi:hypothetical protein
VARSRIASTKWGRASLAGAIIDSTHKALFGGRGYAKAFEMFSTTFESAPVRAGRRNGESEFAQGSAFGHLDAAHAAPGIVAYLAPGWGFRCPCVSTSWSVCELFPA